jgi:hypothetical protein
VSSFAKPYTVKRQNGSLVNGTWVATAPDDVAIMASVQPATARDMQNLPQGRRTNGAYVLYSDTEMLTTIAGDNDLGLDPRKADRITLFGEVFETMIVDPWQNDVLNHYRVLVAKVA